jgi:hypothetical protein
MIKICDEKKIISISEISKKFKLNISKKCFINWQLFIKNNHKMKNKTNKKACYARNPSN